MILLFKYVPQQSAFGREIRTLFDFFISRNIYATDSKVPINFDTFQTVLEGRCCLREEIRVKFLGIGVEQKPKYDQKQEFYVPWDDISSLPEAWFVKQQK